MRAFWSSLGGSVSLNPGALSVIAGVLLLVVEALAFTSYIFPIGAGLIAAGFVYLFYPSFWASLLTFAVVCAFFYWISFKYINRIKGARDILEELSSQEGVVIKKIDDFTYEIRFPLGAAGEEVWNAYSEGELRYGDKVKVTGIKGNKLIVKKVADA